MLSHESVVLSAQVNSLNNDLASDAISALTNLGMNKNEVASMVGGLIKQNPEITINDLIRTALQKRSKI